MTAYLIGIKIIDIWKLPLTTVMYIINILLHTTQTNRQPTLMSSNGQ